MIQYPIREVSSGQPLSAVLILLVVALVIPAIAITLDNMRWKRVHHADYKLRDAMALAAICLVFAFAALF